MTSSLYELIYVSSAMRHMECAELNDILWHAREKNHTCAISGMLLYAEGTFLQVLEGDHEEVSRLYAHICTDRRHHNIMVIQEGPIEKRNFSDWKMGFKYLRTDDFKRIEGFSDLLRSGSHAHKAFLENPSKSHRLLMSFGECTNMTPTPANNTDYQ